MRKAAFRAGLAILANLVAVALIARTGGARQVHAQAPRPMSLVDLASVPRIIDPQLSPDGRSVIYSLQKADWNADALGASLWRQAVAGGDPVQLTKGPQDRIARWSPDGKSIFYFSRPAGQLVVMPAEGGEPRVLPKHSTGLVFPNSSMNDPGLGWSADSRSIFFIAREPASASRATAGHLPVFEQSDFQQQHLWKVDAATGVEQQITHGDWSVVSFRVAGDGKHVILLRAPTPLVNDHYNSEVWIMDLESGSMRQVTKNTVYETEADLSPDGSQVYFLADANENLEDYYGPSLFVAPSAGGKARKLSPSAAYAVELARWAPDGKSILAVINLGVHNEVARIDVATGAMTPLTSGEHQIPQWDVTRDAGQMLYIVDDAESIGGTAWLLPVAGGSPRRVADVYERYGRDFVLPKQERISWKGADGTAIEGILFYPTDYRPGRRYPLVVQLHGGPQVSDKFGYGPGVFINYVPVLTNHGYAVLRPNYRGSAGYGPAFYRDIVGHYFNNMHLDVMAGVDEVVRRGVADPDRLAVAGWSAGGTLVNKLITFTTRFKAASSGAGVANWISMIAQTDTLTRRTAWFHGTPWDKDADLGAYLSQSPIAEVAKVKTPTIFFVGRDDPRVPKEQAEEMYRGLDHNGIPTTLEIAGLDNPTAGGAGHDPGQWRLSQQLAKDNDELAWFEKYVIGRGYTPESAPSSARPH